MKQTDYSALKMQQELQAGVLTASLPSHVIARINEAVARATDKWDPIAQPKVPIDDELMRIITATLDHEMDTRFRMIIRAYLDATDQPTKINNAALETVIDDAECLIATILSIRRSKLITPMMMAQAIYHRETQETFERLCEWIDPDHTDEDDVGATPHAKVKHGLCELCGHVGDDCTGIEMTEDRP